MGISATASESTAPGMAIAITTTGKPSAVPALNPATLPRNRPRLKIESRLAFRGPSKIWPRMELATGTTAAVPRPTSAREVARPR
jgi:hypothetical protein